MPAATVSRIFTRHSPCGFWPSSLVTREGGLRPDAWATISLSLLQGIDMSDDRIAIVLPVGEEHATGKVAGIYADIDATNTIADDYLIKPDVLPALS